ncbi:MAG: hypothetical protein Q8R47_02340 [Nanoarchaeota archaeon]|nr:hypothetical protein [Nanoarchaeota archaeon]
MKKSLAYSIPLLFTAACSDPAPKEGNSACLFQPTEKILQPYYEFLSKNDKVISGGNFCSFSPELYQRVWDKIQEAEETGLPPAASLPQSFYKIEKDQIQITVTASEAHEIYAAHLAHSLWREKNKMFPWSLTEYTQDQLEDLLQPKAWFNSWDEQKKEYSFRHLLDYSPKETFQIANENVSSFSDQKAAMIDIIKSVRSFRHGIAFSYDGEGNPNDDHDPQEIATMQTMHEEKISRHGCQTMSPYIVQLANVLNIPGETIRGYYFGANHRSALFEFTDQVLAHGDDVYGGNTPSSELMDSYKFWEKEVLSYPKGDPTAAHNSMIHEYKMAIKYPGWGIFYGYCRKGGMGWLMKAFIFEKFGPFAAMDELKDLEARIQDITKNCTTEIPLDHPDQ